MNMEPQMYTALVAVDGEFIAQLNGALLQQIEQCEKPIFVCVSGPFRAGKSCKANQLVHGRAGTRDAAQPFPSAVNHLPQTKGLMFYGPIKYETFLRTHYIDHEQGAKATDVWIVDTEGLDVARSRRSKYLFQSLLSFMPFFDFSVVVQSSPINTAMLLPIKNIKEISSLLAPTHQKPIWTILYCGFQFTLVQIQNANQNAVKMMLEEADELFQETANEVKFEVAVVSFPHNALQEEAFEEAYWGQMHALTTQFHTKILMGKGRSGSEFAADVRATFERIVNNFPDPKWSSIMQDNQ